MHAVKYSRCLSVTAGLGDHLISSITIEPLIIMARYWRVNYMCESTCN